MEVVNLIVCNLIQCVKGYFDSVLFIDLICILLVFTITRISKTSRDFDNYQALICLCICSHWPHLRHLKRILL